MGGQPPRTNTIRHIYKPMDYILGLKNSQKTLRSHGIEKSEQKLLKKAQCYEDKKQCSHWQQKYRNKKYVHKEVMLPLHTTWGRFIYIMKFYFLFFSVAIKNGQWKKMEIKEKSYNNNLETNKQWERYIDFQDKMKWELPE